MTAHAVLAHLWQSTLVAGGIALAALAFRRAPAQTRYWIWFAASLKFVIPFAVLSSLGARFEWREVLPPAPLEWTVAIEVVSQPPFAQLAVALPRATASAGVELTTIAAVIWLLGCATVFCVWLLRWRRVSRTVRAGAPVVSGRAFKALHRLEPSSVLRIVSSDASLEPGVFGIVRPVLVWPRDIDTKLDEAQVDAILAHELAHVRRRDNLTAAVHMVVEVIFWFHPLVWWIGSRLVDERERACDEEVVSLGSDPHVYAEGILRTCQFYVESPLSCVSGVTGSDLKKRIEYIMADRPGPGSSRWAARLLFAAAAMMLAAPVVVGALSARRLPATVAAATLDNPSFEIATVKPNTTGAMRVMMRVLPGGTWEATNATLESLIRISYRLQESQLIGGPDWIYSARFDIQAKAAAGSPASDFPVRMQSLLAERFNLKLHNETRDLPLYALVMARRDERPGPQLTTAVGDCAALARGRSGGAPGVKPGERPTCGIINSPGRMTGGSVTMQQMALSLSQYTGRMVIDHTGLSGTFDYHLEFEPDPALRGRGPGGGLLSGPILERTKALDPEGRSIFTALQEQLGLRLEPQRGAVAVVVVDAADRPTGN
jgi:bla regulator protein blaR1